MLEFLRPAVEKKTSSCGADATRKPPTLLRKMSRLRVWERVAPKKKGRPLKLQKIVHKPQSLSVSGKDFAHDVRCIGKGRKELCEVGGSGPKP